ncbi:MAG: ABC transporter permease [FCB group bacterium]|jgi:ABC-type lipoprotein release transport system permease subunit|nr:ABC transporter permease [FCB group bacterium]
MFWLRFSFRSCVRRRRKTVITLLGIAFGVAALIVLGAIMVGVNDTMVENAVSLWAGHLISEQGPMPMAEAVEQANARVSDARDDPSIEKVLPRCLFPGILKGDDPDKGTLPTELWLVDPEKESGTSPVPHSMVMGRYLQDDEQGILLGRAAASELGIKTGDRVTLTTSEGEYSLYVTGIFDTGVEALDRSVAFAPLSMHETFQESRVMVSAAIMCSPGADLEQVRDRLRERKTTPEAKIMVWQDKLPEVAQLVDLNAFAMQVVILLVVAILGFGVANALLISVIDRYRYYAILKAIGVRPSEVVTTIVGEAVLMCLAAGILGTLVGCALSLLWGQAGLDLSKYTSHNPHFSVNSVIHPRLTLAMALGPQALALVAAALASLWPAAVAAKRSVSSGMRDL